MKILQHFMTVQERRRAKIYREKNKGSVVEMADITPPEQGIIGYVFD